MYKNTVEYITKASNKDNQEPIKKDGKTLMYYLPKKEKNLQGMDAETLER